MLQRLFNFTDPVVQRVARGERAVRHVIKLNREKARLEAAKRAGQTIAVVFSPPKTGSTAVANAVEACGEICRAKAHTLMAEHAWDGDTSRRVHPDGLILMGSHYSQAINECIIGPRFPVKFLVTLREPVATNLSGFAFCAKHSWLRDHRHQLHRLDEQALVRLFLERFAHMSVCVWPELELGPALGYDPYAVPFDHARGSQRTTVGPFEVLLLRADLDDARKSQALNELTGRRDIQVGRARESGQGSSGIYSKLKTGIRRHPEYVDRMLQTRYALHWWSDAERAAIRAKWLGA